KPAVNGRRTEDSASMRMSASPSVSQLRALLRIESTRSCGEMTTMNVASSMTAAAATANRRSFSTSIRKNDAAVTSAGSIDIAASHNSASLIRILRCVDRNRSYCWDERIAEPTIDTREVIRDTYEWFDNNAIKNAVEKTPFKGDQI